MSTVKDRLQMQIDVEGANKATKDMNTFNSSMSTSITKLIGIGSAMAIAYKGIGLISSAIKLAQDQAVANAKLSNTLQTTGNRLNTTTSQLNAYANQLQRATGIDDTLISSQTISNLLTFKAITDSGVFKRATELALDMSVALGTDLKSSAIQLGKALEDPIKGISALAKNGITFTKSQIDVIKNLVATNQLAKAQKLILDEVATAYDGLSKEMATPMDIFKQEFNDSLQKLGQTVLPTINEGIKKLNEQLKIFNDAKQSGVKGDDWITKAFDVGKIGIIIAGVVKLSSVLAKAGFFSSKLVSTQINSIDGYATNSALILKEASAFSKLLPILTKVGVAVAITYAALSTLPNFNKVLSKISTFNKLLERTNELNLLAPKKNFFKTMFGGEKASAEFDTSISMMERNIKEINNFKDSLGGLDKVKKKLMLDEIGQEVLDLINVMQALNQNPQSESRTIALKSMEGALVVANEKALILRESLNSVSKQITDTTTLPNTVNAYDNLLQSFSNLDEYLRAIQEAKTKTKEFVDTLFPKNKETMLDKLSSNIQQVKNDISFLNAQLLTTGESHFKVTIDELTELLNKLQQAYNIRTMIKLPKIEDPVTNMDVNDTGSVVSNWDIIFADIRQNFDSTLGSMFTSGIDWGLAITGDMQDVWGHFYTSIQDNFKRVLSQMISDLIASGLLRLLGSILGIASTGGVGMFANGGMFAGVFESIFNGGKGGGTTTSVGGSGLYNGNSNNAVVQALDQVNQTLTYISGRRANPLQLTRDIEFGNNLRTTL